MKAIVYSRYGSPEVLEKVEIPKPRPGEGEVLVRVCSVSLNAADLDLLKGAFVVRPSGPLRPRYRVLGSDIAGVVEDADASVSRLRKGDRVFGDLSQSGYGGFAEYVCAKESALTEIPTGVTFDDASTLPQAALLALQALKDSRPIVPGSHVLINGAGGGIGTFAVQIAKSFGAVVTAVDFRAKHERLLRLGADSVIDAALRDYALGRVRYDRVLDLVAHRSILTYRRLLKPGGTFVMGGGSIEAILQALVVGPLLSSSRGRRLGILQWKPNRRRDLDYLLGLVESGAISPAVDSRFCLDDLGAAMTRLEERKAFGKVVISVSDH